jgi:hypothetical protein
LRGNGIRNLSWKTLTNECLPQGATLGANTCAFRHDLMSFDVIGPLIPTNVNRAKQKCEDLDSGSGAKTWSLMNFDHELLLVIDGMKAFPEGFDPILNHPTLRFAGGPVSSNNQLPSINMASRDKFEWKVEAPIFCSRPR